MPESELVRLRAKLAAREGKPGFSENVGAIRARIAQIEKETTDDDQENGPQGN